MKNCTICLTSDLYDSTYSNGMSVLKNVAPAVLFSSTASLASSAVAFITLYYFKQFKFRVTRTMHDFLGGHVPVEEPDPVVLLFDLRPDPVQHLQEEAVANSVFERCVLTMFLTTLLPVQVTVPTQLTVTKTSGLLLLESTP